MFVIHTYDIAALFIQIVEFLWPCHRSAFIKKKMYIHEKNNIQSVM